MIYEILQDLRDTLTKADNAYYNEDNPIMTDEEYDNKCKSYKEFTGEDWNHNRVPGEVNEAFTPVTHTYKAKSLDKVNTEKDLRKELIRLAPGEVQKKYDGLTLVIYPNGTVVTRGNGDIGEDVTHTAGILAKGKMTNGSPIRGEALLLKSDFEEINRIRVSMGEEPYKNLRNAAAGMVRTKEVYPELLKYLQFVAYELMGSTLSVDDQLSILHSCGYVTPRDLDTWKFTLEGVDETLRYITEYNRDKLDYEIDGLVIKNSQPNSLARFGETAHHFKNAIAYKFGSQGAWTKLIDIRWTVGRTGKIVPNADINPVELLNSTNKKASVHNASMLGRKGICQGCEVYVVKANDVIPDITDVRGGDPTKPFKEPTVCPTCGEPVTRRDSEDNEGVYQLYCENIDCESKTVLRTVHMAQKEALDIDGLAEETVQKMFDDMLIDKPCDIFTLTVDDIESLEGFARPSAEKLFNAIQARRQVTLSRFLYAGGIPLVGKSKSEDLAKEFGNYADLIKDINTGHKRIRSIRGIGDEIINSIIKYCELWSELRHHVTPTEEKKNLKADRQLTIVVTGSFKDESGAKVDRKSIETMIKESGHKTPGSVSRKTDYVLVGDNPGSKKDDALELGVKVITTLAELQGIL